MVVGIEATPTLRAGEFEKISRLVYERCGIELKAGKESLVAARLGMRLRELGMSSFEDYYNHVTSDRSGAAMTMLVDLMTTNHTSFFREPRHFEFLTKTIYPMLRERSRIDLWSAACSSGEEPYTIAMTLLEAFGSEVLGKVRIKATDISTRVLEKARRGVYTADRFEGVAMPLMQKYLLKGRNASAQTYRCKDELRAMIDFGYQNLMEKLPEDYRCSLIFCRNIMLYFDKKTQTDLVARLLERMEPGAYLFIGHSESLNGLSHGLQYVSPAIYKKPGKMGRG